MKFLFTYYSYNVHVTLKFQEDKNVYVVLGLMPHCRDS